MFDHIRHSLLDEARNSPRLLSDLAGLEAYIAESYDSRAFTELLQNADDAGASAFIVRRTGSYLIVANDGKAFTGDDLEALCRSAASSKERGAAIGYRGIGFKSVVGLAHEVHLISGDIKVSFSREKTLEDVPDAERVPLIRIPHEIDAKLYREVMHDADALIAGGYNTIFIFGGLTADAIDQEFAKFDASSLLFLRNVRTVRLDQDTKRKFSLAVVEKQRGVTECTLHADSMESSWVIVTDAGVSLAFSRNVKTGQIEALGADDAVVHAFLPTLEPSGAGMKLNGDFSTDPSRTRVVLDDRTRDRLAACADLACALLVEAMEQASTRLGAGALRALIPREDPRLYQFKKRSFPAEFMAAIHKRFARHAKRLVFRPSWSNASDFHTLAEQAGIQTVPRAADDIDGARSFFRYMGVEVCKASKLLSALASTEISKRGCAEVVSELVRLSDTKQTSGLAVDDSTPILWGNGGRASLREAVDSNDSLDREYLDMVAESGGGLNGLRRLLTALGGGASVAVLVPSAEGTAAKPASNAQLPGIVSSIQAFSSLRGAAQGQQPTPALSLKKWRSAEQQLVEIFESEGMDATDVSRRNLGYDIECQDAAGKRLFVEVKSVDSQGQPFVMTSNEQAVARERGEEYILAIVHQRGDRMEVAFIPHPTKNLTFARQCRQWVWECSEYPFEPTVYDLH